MTMVMMKVTNASVMMTKMKMMKQVKKMKILVTMKVSNHFVKYFQIKLVISSDFYVCFYFEEDHLIL